MKLYKNFITFEGCDGSGKTAQINMLCDYLNKNNISYFLTREPGGTNISEKIRKLILDIKNSDITYKCEALLYAASRYQLVEKEILPHLKNNELVICDRYIDSSFAYQCFGRKLGFNFVKHINKNILDICMPSLTFFINIDPISSFKRKGGNDVSDRLEVESIDFHNNVYQGYLKLSKIFNNRYVVLDGKLSKQDMHKSIINVIEKHIKK